MRLLTSEEDLKFKFPSIRQFRDVVRFYNKAGLAKKVTVNGHPKIHGINGNILFTEDGFAVHSKEATLTDPKDGEGFYSWATSHVDILDWMRILILQRMPTVAYPFVISGEWGGRGVQKKASTSTIEKFFCIFQVANVREEVDDEGIVGNHLQFQGLPDIYLNAWHGRLFDIRDFPSYELEIDFNNPELSVARIAEITKEVEANCPVAKFFGVESDRGEGVVWSYQGDADRHLYFKVKGLKHSASKLKELVQLTPEQINSITEYVEYVCTVNRMEQGMKETGGVTLGNVGPFLKWMHVDIKKEEADTLKAMGLEYDNVSVQISTYCRNWYLSFINCDQA